MTITVLKNCHVFDGVSPELMEGQDVLVEDNRIREISSTPLSAGKARQIDVNGKTLMPGLIDAHVHVNAWHIDLAKNDEASVALRALHAKIFMEAALQRGFTTVRDAGGADVHIHQACELGLIQGPRLFFAGRALSQTGGHGDFRHPLAVDSCACSYSGSISQIADGVDAVRLAAREQLRRGAHQIKIMASGGVASPADPIWMTQYSDDEIQAVVEEAQRKRTYVMAHAYTAEAITRCLKLGVRSIEHGNLIDADAAQLMAAQNAFIVPNLVAYDALAKHGRDLGFPQVSVDKISEVRLAAFESLEICRAANTHIGFGTDLLGNLHPYQCDEFRLRAEVLSPVEILRSATSINAKLLNKANELGTVVPGALADLIVVDGNPLKDLSVFDSQGQHISLIMKDGHLYKNRLSH